MQGRITRVFLRTETHQIDRVSAELGALAAAAGATVQPATFDSTLFSVASSTENQGETLFSAISALVGFMFALNAMLVTVPARRRLIEDIRPQGATRAMIVQILLLDALLIGAFACVSGLAFGEFLSISAFHSTPGYLSAAFPIGTRESSPGKASCSHARPVSERRAWECFGHCATSSPARPPKAKKRWARQLTAKDAPVSRSALCAC